MLKNKNRQNALSCFNNNTDEMGAITIVEDLSGFSGEKLEAIRKKIDEVTDFRLDRLSDDRLVVERNARECVFYVPLGQGIRGYYLEQFRNETQKSYKKFCTKVSELFNYQRRINEDFENRRVQELVANRS